MEWKNISLRARLHIISASVLLVGFFCAAWIYVRAGEGTEGLSGYEVSGGQVYPVSPEDSKMYMHNLELYGGKINVLALEITRFFIGLWRGRTLAYTVAVISIVMSFAFFYAANRRAPRGKDHN